MLREPRQCCSSRSSQHAVAEAQTVAARRLRCVAHLAGCVVCPRGGPRRSRSRGRSAHFTQATARPVEARVSSAKKRHARRAPAESLPAARPLAHWSAGVSAAARGSRRSAAAPACAAVGATERAGAAQPHATFWAASLGRDGACRPPAGRCARRVVLQRKAEHALRRSSSAPIPLVPVCGSMAPPQPANGSACPQARSAARLHAQLGCTRVAEARSGVAAELAARVSFLETARPEVRRLVSGGES